MRFFGLRNCDTCRKALHELREIGADPQYFDVRSDVIEPDDLARFWRAFGDQLVNRRSTTWRNLPPKERVSAPLTLLSCYPTLMKRPVIEANGQLYLGWTSETRAALLG